MPDPSVQFYNQHDPCPECTTPLQMDLGHDATWHEPAQLPKLFCPDCGLDYEIDWERFGNERDRFPSEEGGAA